MPSLKISKKHHRYLNNPFPCPPKSLPFIHGILFFNESKLSRQQIFQIGEDFNLHWSSENGGHLSIEHQSQPGKILWSTVPGEAFISAAAVQTEVAESRGSFLVGDGDVLCICKHQSVEEIRVHHKPDTERLVGDDNVFSDVWKSAEEDCAELSKGSYYHPIVMISGWVFTKKSYQLGRKGFSTGNEKFRANVARKAAIGARYWLLLQQKNENQIGFCVKFGDYDTGWSPTLGQHKKRFQSISWKTFRARRRGVTHSSLWNQRRYATVKSEDETLKSEELVQEFNRVFLTYSSENNERFYGFGEQFSCAEFKGKKVPILVQEQGIGRGDQPITFAANLVSYRSGGDRYTTYAPSPLYMTSKMRAFYLERYNYSVFDLTKPDRVQIQVYGNSALGRIVNGNTPVELLEHLTETIGRPPELPRWIISGAVVGMQGGTAAVRNVWKQLQEHKVPISAFWLQDWVGKRQTILGSQLWWNWEVDADHYAGWRELVDDLRNRNIRVMTYCNPCLVPMDEKTNKHKNMFEEAKSLDILVKNRDGEIYMIPNTAFDVAMLDFTHPEASKWFKRILHEMVDTGVRGWMADFGEGLPLDAYLYSDEDCIAAHNKYPELWARANREFVDEWKSSLCRGKGKEDPEESLVFFMRAGYRDSPKWGMLFWEGDQMASWQENDGIKSSVTGLLSSGLSGFAFNHSDIGGYCAVDMPFLRYQRSQELLMRWMELNAFNTVFRTHEGNKPLENCQFYSNSNTLAHFARCAKLYKAWKFYRIELVKEAAERGLPVARHLFLHYPEDEHVHSLTYQQFLVGTEILVVPVLDKGRKEVKAYFPFSGTGESSSSSSSSSSWKHIWTGKTYTHHQQKQGFQVQVEAPIGYPAVFVKSDSHIGETFLKNIKALKLL